MTDRFAFAGRLAREAGALAHKAFGTSSTTSKGRHDVVTEMDREVERFIRTAIGRAFPGDAVLGEEEGGVPAERLWIIDPIDGTANYARGIPHYCVSIGYVEHGRPLVGALHDPAHDALYVAAEGRGAYLNGARMAVSACAEITSATVECGWSTRRTNEAYLALVARVLAAGAQMRRAGSGALGLADVAAGRSEGYCELHINSWDCAAGILLVREAGGFTNDFFAGEAVLRGNALVATNAALCAKLADVVGIPITG